MGENIETFIISLATWAVKVSNNSSKPNLIVLMGETNRTAVIKAYLGMGGQYNLLKLDPRAQYDIHSKEHPFIDLDKFFSDDSSSYHQAT